MQPTVYHFEDLSPRDLRVTEGTSFVTVLADNFLFNQRNYFKTEG